MSIKHVTKIFEALLEGNVKKAEANLKASLELSFKSRVFEDHEKSMSEDELKHYIKDLHSKASDEHKEAFAKHLEADECNDEAFDQAARKHCTSKDKADGLIHKLEKLVGSKIDPKEYKQDKEKGESDSKAEKESKMKKGQVKEANQIKDDILNELKASTLGNYVKKASEKLGKHSWNNGYGHGRKGAGDKLSDENRNFANKSGRNAIKREKGIKKATDKLVKKAKE